MERLVKSLNGQWKLIREILKKDDHPLYPKKKLIVNEAGGHPVYGERDSKKPAPVAAAPAAAAPELPEITSAKADARKVNNDRLTAQFHDMHQHRGDPAKFNEAKGKLKADLLSAPHGSIDIGHLGDLKEAGDVGFKQFRGSNNGMNPMQDNRFTDADMADVINHHADDIGSLKEFHDKHGAKGLKTLLRTHGANGSPRVYSHLDLAPGVNEDLNELVGYGAKSDEDQEDLGLPDSEYLKTPQERTPEEAAQLDALHHKAWYDEDIQNDPAKQGQAVKEMESHIINRGMKRFNKHHGIKDDVQKSASVETTQEQLEKQIESEMEELAKKCPRCGSASANSSNPSGRCRKHLTKLSADKKKPGHWQRAQTKADDALRRQKGKNGTASKKSSGLGNRKSIVKQTQSAEKKHGQKLSPDRKDNGKGYAASNTRMVPEKLNRGRHKVDPKKLKAWRDRMKKSQLDADLMYTSLLAKANEINNQELVTLLGALTPPEVIELMSALENLEPLKKKSEDDPTAPKSIAAEVGKTHTVEVHPDLDHLYRAKGYIKDSGKDAMHISAFKKNESFNHITNKLPKDSKGFVTPEGIDKHIESLPKHKVDIRVLDAYNRPQEQKHRKNATEYTLSMNMHPETKAKMSTGQLKQWNLIKEHQHSWEPQDKHGQLIGNSLKDKDQIGWVKIDPHKSYGKQRGKIADTNDGGSVWHNGKDNFTIKHPKGNIKVWHDKAADHISGNWSKADNEEHGTPHLGISEDDLKDPKILAHIKEAEGIIKKHKSGEQEHPHWHLDEIQSDFQNSNKIKHIFSMQAIDNETAKSHPDWNKTNDELQSAAESDSNHPLAKLWQNADDGNREERDDQIHELVAPHAQKIMQEKYPELNTPDGADPVDMTPEQEDEYQNLIQETTGRALDDPDHPLHPEVNDIWENDLDPDNDAKHQILNDVITEHLKSKDPEFFKKPNATPKEMLKLLSHGHDDPQHMLHSAVNALARKLNIKSTSMDTPEDQAKKSHLRSTDLPVHQIDTYSKRPKKLGMQLVDKQSLLGRERNNETEDIQYARLHKRLKRLYARLNQLKKIN